MISVSFFSSKKSFFLTLCLVFTQRTHAMETIIKSGIKAFVGVLPGLALSNAKHISEHFVPAVIIACLGSERLTNFTTYSPGYKTQAGMLGISFIANWLLFYKQQDLFKHPAVHDIKSKSFVIESSVQAIDKVGCGGLVEENKDFLFRYDRPGLLTMGIIEFLILCGFSCTVLALQKNLSFKAIQYSAFCAFWDVVPALAYLLWQAPPQKDSQKTN